jgi:hypothetical protein
LGIEVTLISNFLLSLCHPKSLINSGSSVPYQWSVYGTQYVASSATMLGARLGAQGAMDAQDGIWIFGGDPHLHPLPCCCCCTFLRFDHCITGLGNGLSTSGYLYASTHSSIHKHKFREHCN